MKAAKLEEIPNMSHMPHRRRAKTTIYEIHGSRINLSIRTAATETYTRDKSLP